MGNISSVFNAIVASIFGVIGFVTVKSVILANVIPTYCAVEIQAAGGTQAIANAARCIAYSDKITAIGANGGLTGSAFRALFDPTLPATTSATRYWAKLSDGAWSSAEVAILSNAVPVAIALITFVLAFSAIGAIRQK